MSHGDIIDVLTACVAFLPASTDALVSRIPRIPMIDEFAPPVDDVPVPSDILEEVERNLQVRIKSDGDRLLLLLPPQPEEESVIPELTWNELWQQLKQRLNAGDRFWQANTTVHLLATNRLLDSRQLQEISDALAEVQLVLERVYTSRRQTAVAAVTAGYSVEQQPPQDTLHQSEQPKAKPLAEPLYLMTTVRSGTEIRHPGSVVLIGDLNPGGVIAAEGDILVWGRLRGIAHAGVGGNTQCTIMALQMEPTQIRIAEAVARAPANPPMQYYPEVAYITPQGIRISRAADFSRSQLLAQ
jgi:septum site-determining protein MinC